MGVRLYHTLLVRDTRDGDWGIDFGDYDENQVKDEMQVGIDQGEPKWRFKIVCTSDVQDAIETEVEWMNAGK